VAVTWADVSALAPDVATVGATAQTHILAYVNAVVTSANFGARTTLAACYLAAHYGLLVTRGTNGQSGPVVSEALDGASISYAAYLGGSSDDLDSTPYGRSYRRLARDAGMAAGGFAL
jgi:hypothetical protein